MLITRLEHAGLLIEAGGDRLAIDLGEYITPAGVKALGRLNAVIVTHQHSDHYDLANIIAADAPIAAPGDVIAQVPPGRVTRQLRAGETMTLAGFRITPVSADHGPKLSRPIENYGLVIERGVRRVWMLGDMAVPPKMPPAGRFDHLVVSIDASDFVFTAAQAAEFIAFMGHRGPVTPIHDGGEDDGVAREFERLGRGRFRTTLVPPGSNFAVTT